MAKMKSFEARVKCVSKNPGEQLLRQRKPIPHRGANHRECTGLGCGVRAKGTKSNPCSNERSGARGGTAKILEVSRSKTQDKPPDQGTNTEYDPLLIIIIIIMTIYLAP